MASEYEADVDHGGAARLGTSVALPSSRLQCEPVYPSRRRAVHPALGINLPVQVASNGGVAAARRHHFDYGLLTPRAASRSRAA